MRGGWATARPILPAGLPPRYGPTVAGWDDVRTAVTTLPEVDEESPRGLLGWRVRKRTFVWERPLRKADLAALGAAAPDGPVLAAYVPDEGVKHALIADDPDACFTTPHFDGYPVVLVRLDRIAAADLRELIVEAWLVRAPKRLAAQYLDAVT